MVAKVSESAETQRAAICVVESDSRERDALLQLLRRLGKEIVAFESAEALLEALDRTPMKVLIASLELDGLSGLDLLHELRHRGRPVPAILLAGQSDVATAVGAIRAGALDFIQKPVIDRILLRRVRDALEQAEA